MIRRSPEESTPGLINPAELLPEDIVMMAVISGSLYRFTVTEIETHERSTGDQQVPSGNLAKVAGGDLNENFDNFERINGNPNEVKARAALPIFPLQKGVVPRFEATTHDINDRNVPRVNLPRLWLIELVPGLPSLDRSRSPNSRSRKR